MYVRMYVCMHVCMYPGESKLTHGRFSPSILHVAPTSPGPGPMNLATVTKSDQPHTQAQAQIHLTAQIHLPIFQHYVSDIRSFPHNEQIDFSIRI